MQLLAPTYAALAFGLTALAAVTYLPKADNPVLVYPLTAQGKEKLLQLYSEPDTRILGRSTWGDSLIIRLPTQSEVSFLWHDHVLMLNADAPGCRPIGANT